MRYKLTILNISAYLFVLCCILYALKNYHVLSEGEGWGVVNMVGLAGIGLSAVFVDWAIQKLIKSKQAAIILNIAVVLIYAVLLFFGQLH